MKLTTKTISVSEKVFLASCDICTELGRLEEQKVKTVSPWELDLCKPCYISLIAIERDDNERPKKSST